MRSTYTVLVALALLIMAAGCEKIQSEDGGQTGGIRLGGIELKGSGATPEEASATLETSLKGIAAAGEAHVDDCAAMVEAARPHARAIIPAVKDLLIAAADDPQKIEALMTQLQTSVTLDPAVFQGCAQDAAVKMLTEELAAQLMAEVMPIAFQLQMELMKQQSQQAQDGT